MATGQRKPMVFGKEYCLPFWEYSLTPSLLTLSNGMFLKYGEELEVLILGHKIDRQKKKKKKRNPVLPSQLYDGFSYFLRMLFMLHHLVVFASRRTFAINATTQTSSSKSLSTISEGVNHLQQWPSSAMSPSWSWKHPFQPLIGTWI